MKSYFEFINEDNPYDDENAIKTSDKLSVGDKLRLRRIPIYASRDTGLGAQKESIKTIKSIVNVKVENVNPEEYEGISVFTTIYCHFKEGGLFSVLFKDNDLVSVSNKNARYQPLEENPIIRKK